MSGAVYQCWCPYAKHLPNQNIEADSSFAARKVYAERHHRQVSEICARRQNLPIERKIA